MRYTLAYLLIPILVGGCASQGTIVEKRSRLSPDSGMIGTEGVNSFVFRGPNGLSRQPIGVSDPQYWIATGGSYKFILRDRNGNVHSQLVTPDVFARYNVGDYFDDSLPPAQSNSSKEGATRKTASSKQTASPKRQLAQKHRSHRKVAKHHRQKKTRVSKHEIRATTTKASG